MSDEIREAIFELCKDLYRVTENVCEVLPDRRERIAAAALQGLLVRGTNARDAAFAAVQCADFLIAALDKEPQP